GQGLGEARHAGNAAGARSLHPAQALDRVAARHVAGTRGRLAELALVGADLRQDGADRVGHGWFPSAWAGVAAVDASGVPRVQGMGAGNPTAPGARPRKTATPRGRGALQRPAARGAGVLSPAPRCAPARSRTCAASPPGWYGAG